MYINRIKKQLLYYTEYFKEYKNNYTDFLIF